MIFKLNLALVCVFILGIRVNFPLLRNRISQSAEPSTSLYPVVVFVDKSPFTAKTHSSGVVWIYTFCGLLPAWGELGEGAIDRAPFSLSKRALNRAIIYLTDHVCYSGAMASLESVRLKMYRAGQHWEELKREIAAYLDTRPGGLVEMPDSTPQRIHYRYRETSPIPARFGIIAGDCLQNMRSAFDYLAWELVLANGAIPTERTMFPIALTPKAYKSAIERKQVDGISPRALALIDALQPYKLQKPEFSALAVLDLLTNINKHRRIPLTSLQGAADSVEFEFLHMPVSIERRNGDEVIEVIRSRVYVAIDESIAKPREICLILNTMAKSFAEEVFPLFQEFFE